MQYLCVRATGCTVDVSVVTLLWGKQKENPKRKCGLRRNGVITMEAAFPARYFIFFHCGTFIDCNSFQV